MTLVKTCICGAFLAAFSLVANAQKPDWQQYNRYHNSNVEVKTLPLDQRKVVFMGNSITDNWYRQHPDFFKTHGYVGRGISGQTSHHFLVRFREDVIELHPQIVVINAATNDIAENICPYNEDVTFGNIVSMVELAKVNGIEPILSTVLPAAYFPWNRSITDSSDKIDALNARLKKYAEDNGIEWVDYYSALVTPNDPKRSLNHDLGPDAVHPNDAGYTVMEGIIVPILDKHLAKLNSKSGRAAKARAAKAAKSARKH